MTVTSADVHRMTETLYIDGPLRGRMSSKFWILLLLASVIATAGVIADSTATVIGAMIVAPLMTPILGTALAVVLADREHVVRSVLLVLGGALVVISIGFLMGLLGAPLDGFATNGQVISRIHPKLIDLIAALATGTGRCLRARPLRHLRHAARGRHRDLAGAAAGGGGPAALRAALLGRGGRRPAVRHQRRGHHRDRSRRVPRLPHSSGRARGRHPGRAPSRALAGRRRAACSPSWPSR